MHTLKDAIYGMAVADALGVPFEFMPRGSYNATGMTNGGAHNQPTGTWSDDTSMAIATCKSIQEKGGIDLEDIRSKFGDWLHKADYTAGGTVFDCGITVTTALRQGKGLADEYSNGNGSLMRIIPLAFVPGVTDEQIGEVSAITHAHPVSREACVLYVRLAQALCSGADAKTEIAALRPKAHALARLPEIAELPETEIRSSGYVVDTIEAALWALATTDNYCDCVLRAVNLGKDTDTVGAVAGGLAGIVYGMENIPAEWLEVLRGKDVLDDCLF